MADGRAPRVRGSAVRESGRSRPPTLGDSDARYRAMFEMAGDAVFLIDAESKRILEANRSAEALYGYTRAELLRMRNVDLSAEPESTARAVDEERTLVLVRQHRKRDGSVFPVEITGSFFIWRGRATHIAMVRDITERMRVEAQREDVERIIQHELRSPVAAMMHLYYLLSETGELNDEQRALLRSAQDTARHMLDVVSLHQDLHLIESGAYEAEPVPVDMVQVIRDSVAELRARSALRKVAFASALDGSPIGPDTALVVAGQRTLLHVMAANLLRNALEASPEGAMVTVALRRTADGPELAIHNQGAVPAGIRARFFEKYATSGKRGGTGLGAYAARLVADALGRGIAMETADDSGTTITVRLRGGPPSAPPAP